MPRNPHIEAILRDRYRGRRKVPKPMRVSEPRGLERSYLRDILDLLKPAQELVEELLVPRLPEFDAELILDAYPDAIESIFEDIRLRYGQLVTGGTTKGIASNQGVQLDLFNREQTARQFKRVLGIDVFNLTPELTTQISAFTVDNVALIESISERYLKDVEQVALRNLRAGNRSSEWREELAERFDVTQSRAALIARDQTNKFNGELNRARQTSLGIETYTWRTSEDERVRPSHEAINGNVYAWEGEPKPPEGHPGQPIQCRCSAEPDVEGTLERLGV
jgi:SPP1 gp7 family putative phage head morphogenesis protein